MFNHPEGFEYEISGRFNVIVSSADTDVEEYITDVHFLSLSFYLGEARTVLAPQHMLDIYSLILFPKWTNSLRIFQMRLKLFFGKIYKYFKVLENKGKKSMPDQAGTPPATPAIPATSINISKEKNFFEQLFSTVSKATDDMKNKDGSIDFKKMNEENLKALQVALEELTTLRIKTTGSDGKTIETSINVTGDIASVNPYLTDEKLVAYHERMTGASVDIMKLYAQIFVQIASILVPWAGIKLPQEATTNMMNLIKGFELGKKE